MELRRSNRFQRSMGQFLSQKMKSNNLFLKIASQGTSVQISLPNCKSPQSSYPTPGGPTELSSYIKENTYIKMDYLLKRITPLCYSRP